MDVTFKLAEVEESPHGAPPILRIDCDKPDGPRAAVEADRVGHRACLRVLDAVADAVDAGDGQCASTVDFRWGTWRNLPALYLTTSPAIGYPTDGTDDERQRAWEAAWDVWAAKVAAVLRRVAAEINAEAATGADLGRRT